MMRRDIEEIIGEHIREIREELGISPECSANIVGWDRQRWNNIERENIIKTTTLKKVVLALGLNPNELYRIVMGDEYSEHNQQSALDSI